MSDTSTETRVAAVETLTCDVCGQPIVCQSQVEWHVENGRPSNEHDVIDTWFSHVDGTDDHVAQWDL